MTTQQMLDERYGRRTRRQRVWAWSVIGAVAVIAVGTLWAVTFMNTLNAVDVDTTTYRIQDERAVSLDFQVTAPVGSEVVCVLEADDQDHGIVGWKVVQLPASSAHMQVYRETIPTLAPAVEGLVNSCWVS